MHYTSSSMQAYAIDLSIIEIQVSKEHYHGHVETFYIRQSKDIEKLDACMDREDTKFCYYRTSYTLDITKVYDILNGYGLTVVLQYEKLIYMPTFDINFCYDSSDLGASYQVSQTTWKVWAPTALQMFLVLHQNTKKTSHAMKKDKKGVFSITLIGNYDSVLYTYLVNHGRGFVETLDPYSYSSISNARASVVIDVNRCKNGSNKQMLLPINKKTDSIIYEVSVRDFTSDKSINCEAPSTYLGFVETGLRTKGNNIAGLDYLVSLGITHVQIMPLQDFATIEENHTDLFYNWGYDPMQYGVPEGSYSSNPDAPYARIIECQKMISTLHQHGLRVIIDVVYNHMYDASQSAFENLVPGYFFRRRDDGSLSNGSWCGNEVNTSAKMVQKYLVDMSARWVTLYGIDGLRLDLMGLIDTETLNIIYHTCHKEDTNFMMYGEGWNMDTVLSYEERGIQDNHSKIPMIGFFNDTFRDKLKGASSDNHLQDRGYFSGNMYNTEILCQCLKNNHCYSAVAQSINYTECHDNATIYDKFSISNMDEEEVIRRKRQKLATMVTIMAQGIPFLHSGQIWYRTKKGVTNSYRSDDSINKIDWSQVDVYQIDIKDIQKIIQIRKDYTSFWYDTNLEVENNITTKIYDQRMVKYELRHDNEKFRKLCMYINGSDQNYIVNIEEHYVVLYSDENLQEIVEIPPLSMVILGVQ